MANTEFELGALAHDLVQDSMPTCSHSSTAVEFRLYIGAQAVVVIGIMNPCLRTT